VITDDGTGMDTDTLEQVFEPFFTTKPKEQGTGLGLATVYGIVKQNGGFINVYSEPGSGTTFKVYFPVTEDQPHQATRPQPSEKLHAGDETILLVEDDPAILKLGQRTLEQLGYTVLAAQRPRDALKMIDGTDGDIDLLVTDVVMPEMNGKDLLACLSENRPGLRALFMSGYTANVIAHRGVLDEGIEFLQKPFRAVDLAARVRQVLDPA
jgi:CheY-like chemotaxis protein